VLQIIASGVAMHIQGLRQSWQEKVDVKKKFDATFQSSQIESNMSSEVMKQSNLLFADKGNPVKALSSFLHRMERMLKN